MPTCQAELAKTLLGRKPGESVEISGETYRITAIEPYQ